MAHIFFQILHPIIDIKFFKHFQCTFLPTNDFVCCVACVCYLFESFDGECSCLLNIIHGLSFYKDRCGEICGHGCV